MVGAAIIEPTRGVLEINLIATRPHVKDWPSTLPIVEAGAEVLMPSDSRQRYYR
jgi:hypothetical protein